MILNLKLGRLLIIVIYKLLIFYILLIVYKNMDILFNYLNKFIIKKANHNKDYNDLIIGKKYLITYYDDSKNIIAIEFAGFFEEYSRASPTAIGYEQIGEGYYFKSNITNKSDKYHLGYCFGEYLFDFYELDNSFTIDVLYNILKENYTFDIDCFNDSNNIKVYKNKDNNFICSCIIHIDNELRNDDKNKKYYHILFNENAHRYYKIFINNEITYDELFIDEFYCIIKHN
jgi:hypothetical protein